MITVSLKRMDSTVYGYIGENVFGQPAVVFSKEEATRFDNVDDAHWLVANLGYHFGFVEFEEIVKN